ncbi:uncharacterized protein J4E84_005575 [Alternaria hordeiaustralica]|uniref:uncharacterized protein n=1 Tax=Alternaria hordeiaustralica TaxID=1187925 RepID=UPI0020C258DF|nr:uncharacterized protein J4E84_005575 [Alternaria hordeiaustralica]KAI4687203.1 hypothetical protein J4E84_005575 [Alternaria hordeiaustralica]
MNGLCEGGFPKTPIHGRRHWLYTLAYLDLHDDEWYTFLEPPLRRYDDPFTKTQGRPETRLTWISVSRNNVERTLDEAYYPGLSTRALRVRNQDQVVSHSKDNFVCYDRRESGVEKTDETAFILMVPQLWVYKLGNIIVSAYSMQQEAATSLEPFRDGAEKEDPAAYAEILIGLTITSLVNRFGKAYRDLGVDYPPTLDLFETRVVKLLEEVRLYTEKPAGGMSSFSGLEYRRERYFIHVISDVRSELAMIQHFLEQQERVLKLFLEDRPYNSVNLHPQDWAPVERSQETIMQYMRRVRKIDGDAERIEKSIQDMLNLKRTHASIRDAHSSLVVSTAVIGFTVITVVFTPLAFLTALFALKIDGFESLQVFGRDGVYHSGKIGGIFAWAKGSSSKGRAKIPDPESPKRDDQPEAKMKSSKKA